jgi:hypothetical protein
MRKRLEHALRRLWRWSQKSPAERRAARVRVRFWADLREGQREAEARLRPEPATCNGALRFERRQGGE